MLDSRRPWWLQPRTLNLWGFLWCAGLMAYALFVQFGLKEEPCPLCILQRYAVITVGLFFLLAWALNPASLALRRAMAVLIVLAAVAGMVVAGRHIYVINAPAGSVAECGASFEYMMDVLPLHEVLGKVMSGSGECAKVSWRLFGLSMPTYVFANLLGLAGLGILANGFKSR